jgi:parallel beta-helix repeat protein
MRKITAGLFISLLLIGSLAGASKTSILDTSSMPGTIRHVGGTGPGNYTSIQEAVNASEAGDTVFVHNDSAPYYEHVTINTSLTVLGEDRRTTILNGSDLNTPVITVLSEQVTIQNLTILNASEAVMINACNVSLYQNTILQCQSGITAVPGSMEFAVGDWDFSLLSGIIITNNTIADSEGGITIIFCTNALIYKNKLIDDYCGITLGCVFNSTILYNTVFRSELGIGDTLSSGNTYSRNMLMNDTYGIMSYGSHRNYVRYNNFINNTQNACFEMHPLNELLTKLRINTIFPLHQYHVLGRIIWMGNYWGAPRLLPYPIVGRSGPLVNGTGIIPLIAFDWHPAQAPYEIR